MILQYCSFVAGVRVRIARISSLPRRGKRHHLSLADRRRAASMRSPRQLHAFLACKAFQAQSQCGFNRQRMSVSHSQTWLVLAQATGKLGVDAEDACVQISEAQIKLACASAEEKAWCAKSDAKVLRLQLWLAKESYFKATSPKRRVRGGFRLQPAVFEPAQRLLRDAAGWVVPLHFLRLCGVQVCVCRL
jgi:4'-phosphopantetheinyl transferase superfamily